MENNQVILKQTKSLLVFTYFKITITAMPGFVPLIFFIFIFDTLSFKLLSFFLVFFIIIGHLSVLINVNKEINLSKGYCYILDINNKTIKIFNSENLVKEIRYLKPINRTRYITFLESYEFNEYYINSTFSNLNYFKKELFKKF